MLNKKSYLGVLWRWMRWACWICILACGSPDTHWRGDADYRINIISWTDSSKQLNSTQLELKYQQTVVPTLPSIADEDSTTLYVHGSMRTDKKGGVLVIETRFMYTPQQVPVKLIVMGSIEGNSKQKRERLVTGVLKDVRDGLKSHIRICKGGPKIWKSALNSPEADEQILAMALLGKNGIKTATSSIIQLLDDPRDEVGTAATHAVSILAQEKDVLQIIAIAQKGKIETEARCVQVLSKVGGMESIAFIEMLAVGHENPHLRELCFNALKRLK